jgi:hypothetical protein
MTRGHLPRGGNIFTARGAARPPPDGARRPVFGLHRQDGMTRISLALAVLAALLPGSARARCSIARAAVLADRCDALTVPVATRRTALAGNLSADARSIEGGFVADGTYVSAFRTSIFPGSMSVVDAAGHAHALLMFFTRTGRASATLNLAIDAGDTGGTPGTLVAVAPEQALRFGTSGRLRSRWRVRAVLPLADGPAQPILVDLASMTMRPGPSGIVCMSQDGCALAD